MKTNYEIGDKVIIRGAFHGEIIDFDLNLPNKEVGVEIFELKQQIRCSFKDIKLDRRTNE
jgi:hypothetical protein